VDVCFGGGEERGSAGDGIGPCFAGLVDAGRIGDPAGSN
jgi:hypothetical protein